MTRIPSHHRAGGFSFVELLFAMAILSVGMIGVAAAVYVGVDQTKSTLDDTAAAGVARQAAAVMGRLMTLDNTPEGSGGSYRAVYALNNAAPPEPALQDVVRSQQISGTDRRFAWVPLFRRATGSTTADLLIVVTRNQSGDDYSMKDVTSYDVTDYYKPALVPMTVDVEIKDAQLRVTSTEANGVVDGAFLVLTGTGSEELNGRVLKVGGPESGGVWSLAPGQDLTGVTGEYTGQAFVFGRPYADVTKPAKGYAGASQAVVAYSTIVSLR